MLNAIDLEVNHAELIFDGSQTLKPTRSLSTENETLTLDFEKPLSPGEAILEIHFVGELNDKMKGFYRSKYIL